jgi:serine/threonine-protein kinase RsbT
LVVARDEGPGITNPELAMRDGYSTSQSLGMGLPGAKRLMDEFELSSIVGKGTTIVMKKWLR